MGHQGSLPDKAGGIGHDLCHRRGLANHGVADACQFGNERGNIAPGIHQTLKLIDHLAPLGHGDGDLGQAITVGR